MLLLVGGVGVWWVLRILRPPEITPTELTPREEAVLEEKLEILRRGADRPDELAEGPGDVSRDSRDLPWTAEPGEGEDEDFVRRPIVITEREINGMLAHNTDLGDAVRVRLTPDRVKININFAVPEEAPVFGGKTLRFAALARAELGGKVFDVRVEKLSLGGIPLPGAWTGDLLDVNLAEALFPDSDAMAVFSAGVESFEIRRGEMEILLAE